MLTQVVRLGRRGHGIDRAAEFQSAFAEAHAYAYHADRIRAGDRQLDEGRGIPFEEARDERRRRHIPPLSV